VFLKYFHQTKNSVVHFENLGKDILLFVSSSLSENSDFPHIASFVRNAPKGQLQAFCLTIGKQLVNNLKYE
jgi:hypothetical protein